MKLYNQPDDVVLIGVQVRGFPDGIKEAFGDLMKILGAQRDYFGVSWLDENDRVIYYAMAREGYAGEGKQNNYETLTMEKGDYQTEAIQDWHSKTDDIKDVLQHLMGNNKPDKNNPCIEWYKSNEEMLCMLKV